MTIAFDPIGEALVRRRAHQPSRNQASGIRHGSIWSQGTPGRCSTSAERKRGRLHTRGLRPKTLLALLAAALAGLSAPAARAGSFGEEIGFTRAPTRDELRDLTRQLGVALAPPALTSADPLGTLHLDLAASATATRIDGTDRFWRIASRGDTQPTYFTALHARARLGLPLGIDAGVCYGRVPDSHTELVSFEGRWAFFHAGPLGLATQAAHSRLQGVDELDLRANSLDLVVGLNMGIVSPYAGAGALWFSSEVHDIPSAPGFRKRASERTGRVFAGARAHAGPFNPLVEYQRADGVESLSLKLAFLLP